MTITLIEQHEYDMLMETQAKFPNLTYQNEGYDKPDKTKWSKEDLKAFESCSAILSQSIKGFSEFNHFKMGNNRVRVRFQYDWDADNEKGRGFIGVGYLFVDELLNGFENKEEV